MDRAMAVGFGALGCGCHSWQSREGQSRGTRLSATHMPTAGVVGRDSHQGLNLKMLSSNAILDAVPMPSAILSLMPSTDAILGAVPGEVSSSVLTGIS